MSPGGSHSVCIRTAFTFRTCRQWSQLSHHVRRSPCQKVELGDLDEYVLLLASILAVKKSTGRTAFGRSQFVILVLRAIHFVGMSENSLDWTARPFLTKGHTVVIIVMAPASLLSLSIAPTVLFSPYRTFVEKVHKIGRLRAGRIYQDHFRALRLAWRV